ncbi:hypothetical protein Nepgr_021781 [Nepenthes gracilis]|uniref:Uncharacterized protein n=1 Tax=Nepenthes gracilis TaxID=150966 RepID=A0AAD3SY36_NEPGR|nr:hypothetical protein Nepgr_021781 [Nepenthes gracilis]
MGNRDGLSNSALPSAVREERADCKFSPQRLADQVIAHPRSDQVRLMKQASSLMPLKSILKKPTDRRLTFPSLADLVATDCRRVGICKGLTRSGMMPPSANNGGNRLCIASQPSSGPLVLLDMPVHVLFELVRSGEGESWIRYGGALVILNSLPTIADARNW